MESFIMYAEYLEQVQDLDLLQRGRLFTAILKYANGADMAEIAADCDQVSLMAFRFIKARIDRDKKSYDEKCAKNRENVRKRWAKQKDTTVSKEYDRIPPDTPKNEKSGEDTTVYDRIPSNTTAYEPIHNDNDHDNDHDNDNDLKKSDDKSSRKESADDSAEEKEEDPPVHEIITYLNVRTGRNYRTDSEYIGKLIRDRWREGHRLPDFVKVIDLKTAEWRGTRYEKYLRPTTLFAEHFEEYVNQPEEKREAAPVIVNPYRGTDYDGLLAQKAIGG